MAATVMDLSGKTCLSYAEPGSWDIKEPLPGTSNMPGSGGGGIVTCLVVKDRLGV